MSRRNGNNRQDRYLDCLTVGLQVLFLSFQAPGNEWISSSYFRQYTLLLNGLEILTRFCGGLRTYGFQEKG